MYTSASKNTTMRTSYKVGRTEIVVWQRKVLVKVRMVA